MLAAVTSHIGLVSTATTTFNLPYRAATIDLRDTLSGLGIEVHMSNGPNEVDPAIPFAEDTHAGYDPAAANAFCDSWCKPTECSAGSVHGSSARSALSTSSGVLSIWYAADSRVASHPGIPVVRRTAATG